MESSMTVLDLQNGWRTKSLHMALALAMASKRSGIGLNALAYCPYRPTIVLSVISLHLMSLLYNL